MASSPEPGATLTLRDPEQDAHEVLTEWRSEHPGSPALPVDPIRIARWLGLTVYVSHLVPDVTVTLHRARDKTAEIDLNRDDTTAQQRISCAHALGHLIDHAYGPDPAVMDVVDFRITLALGDSDPVEVYANRFAAALLAPADDLRPRRHHPVSALATTFGMPPGPLRSRLTRLTAGN